MASIASARVVGRTSIPRALGIRLAEDLQGHVLRNQRVVYERKVYELAATEQRYAPIMDDNLLARIRALGGGHEWLFQSRNGTPINPGNILRRFVHPAAEAVGISLGGWHDFRHSFSTFQRKKGTHPKVISALMGHSRVHLAMNVYDHCDLRDFEQALMPVGNQLLAIANNSTPPSSAIQ